MNIVEQSLLTHVQLPFLFLDHSSSWEVSLSIVRAEPSSRPEKIDITEQ
jgi:hypothetical protein